MAFLSSEQLKSYGFNHIGDNVLISDKASFYNTHQISIGSHVRIDDFCVLSGNITIGNYIHIGAFCALYGKFGIEIENYAGLSPRCTIFSASDDFSGEYLISPMVPEIYTNVTGGRVLIKSFSQIGANSVILPNITISEGVAIGAMSLVNTSLESWGIYVGVPVKKIRIRNQNCKNFISNF